MREAGQVTTAQPWGRSVSLTPTRVDCAQDTEFLPKTRYLRCWDEPIIEKCCTASVHNPQRLYEAHRDCTRCTSLCARPMGLVRDAQILYLPHRSGTSGTEPVGRVPNLYDDPPLPGSSTPILRPPNTFREAHPPGAKALTTSVNWAIPPKSATMADGLRVISANTAHSNKGAKLL